MKTFNQLNPSIYVEVVENDLEIPTGKGFAFAILDYSQEHDLIWVVFLDDNRECWSVPNRFIRIDKNLTLLRT